MLLAIANSSCKETGHEFASLTSVLLWQADKLAEVLQATEASQASFSEKQMGPLASLLNISQSTSNKRLAALLQLASSMLAYSAKNRCSVIAACSRLEAIR